MWPDPLTSLWEWLAGVSTGPHRSQSAACAWSCSSPLEVWSSRSGDIWSRRERVSAKVNRKHPALKVATTARERPRRLSENGGEFLRSVREKACAVEAPERREKEEFKVILQTWRELLWGTRRVAASSPAVHERAGEGLYVWTSPCPALKPPQNQTQYVHVLRRAQMEVEICCFLFKKIIITFF